jgi:2-polyprenyl-3-methyl-5-hydroxy-6-metoxy-1,4-benzoquinol methylase
MTASDTSAICPVCQFKVDATQYKRAYVAPFNRQLYQLHACPDCRLEFWTPLKMLPAFYEHEGFSAYSDYHGGRRHFPPWCEAFFVLMKMRSGRLLDVGCGDGFFLARAQSLGFEAWGIDLDKNSVRSAVDNLALDRVRHSTLDEFALVCNHSCTQFDLVTFFEVLEHQDSPADFVAQVASLLKPGGKIAGSVPNSGRFLACLDRRLSAGDLPPHHFLWFTARSLKRLFESKGFTNVIVQPSGNIAYQALKEKVGALLNRHFCGGATNLAARMTLWPVAHGAAGLLWLGYRLRPAHLYFQADARGQHRVA